MSQTQINHPTKFSWRYGLAIILTIFILLASYQLAVAYPEYQFGFISLMGVLFGIVLQRSRFCFYCILTDYFVAKDRKSVV